MLPGRIPNIAELMDANPQGSVSFFEANAAADAHIEQDEENLRTIGLQRDVIAARDIAYAALHHKLMTDKLTGLPNLEAMRESTLKMIEWGTANNVPVLVVMGDLDGFKKVNDTFGHHSGDQVLQDIGSQFRAKDLHGIGGRRSGDEFLFLFPLERHLNSENPDALPLPLTPEEIEKACRVIVGRLRSGVDNYATKSGMPIGISLGSTVRMPEDPRTVDELFMDAEGGMRTDKLDRGAWR